MNGRERQMVQDLLVAVSDAGTILNQAFDKFGQEFLAEMERQKDEAEEAEYRREADRDTKLQALEFWGRK